MGADMIVSCAPACKLTAEREAQIELIVRSIPDDDEDLKELIEQLGYDDVAEAKSRILQECRTAQDAHREITTLCLPGCPYQVRVAGGLSWGDVPCEGYTTLEHIERCPQLWQLLELFAREDALLESENPSENARSSKRQDVTVVMTSDEFGNEHFHYGSITEALAAVQRLVHGSERRADGIERLIGIVVNPGEQYDDPQRSDDDHD